VLCIHLAQYGFIFTFVTDSCLLLSLKLHSSTVACPWTSRSERRRISSWNPSPRACGTSKRNSRCPTRRFSIVRLRTPHKIPSFKAYLCSLDDFRHRYSRFTRIWITTRCLNRSKMVFEYCK
jgi:hypothetical protein